MSLAISVCPERGAKITSLRDGDGVEWLTQATGYSYRQGLPFGQAEMAGWDECVPSVTQCVVGGESIPDHGDAWDVSWQRSGHTFHHAGTSMAYRMARTHSLTASGGVRLRYRAETDQVAVPFMWVAHPQFAAPSGTRVEFTHPPKRVVDVLAVGWPSQAWQKELGSIDSVASGACRKYYVDPRETPTSVDLVRPDDRRLRMTFSATVPYLGLWFDNGAWARDPVVALEPALGYADSLAVAVELGRAPVLTPTTPLEWWIELHRV